ncbi:hypothetical protein BD311DRAFT_672155, partial [Dichomitus squalens]
ALFIYDYLITFGDEATLFWMPWQTNGAFSLFLLNRYIPLTAQIIGNMSLTGSYHVNTDKVLRPLQYIPWATFSALRSYSLYQEPGRLMSSVAILTLSLMPMFIDMIVNLHFTSMMDAPTAGFVAVTSISTQSLRRILLVLSDLQIAFTLNSVSFSWANLNLLKLTLVRLTAVLTWRFLINLQQVKRRLAGSSRSLPQLSELAFQSHVSDNPEGFIASMGAHLSFHDNDVEDNEDQLASERITRYLNGRR